MAFIVDIPLYDCEIHVLNGVSELEFDKYCIRNFTGVEISRTSSSAAFWIIYNSAGKATYLIDFVIKLDDNSRSVNTIVHESTHATIEILKRHKINFIYDITDEVYCCLNGFISGEIYKGVFKK